MRRLPLVLTTAALCGCLAAFGALSGGDPAAPPAGPSGGPTPPPRAAARWPG